MSSDNSKSPNPNHSSTWWGFAQSAWSSVKDTANDFQQSFQDENEQTLKQIKDNINKETLTNQIETATNTINTFLNKTIKTIKIDNDNDNKSNNNQITPKPFEKERATYCSDLLQMKQHKDKYNEYISKELNISCDDLCLKGRKLLNINSAINTYFVQLVPNEMNEILFWKRYFYWKYQNEEREKLLLRYTLKNNDNNDNIMDKNDNDNDLEPVLGKIDVCENAIGNDNSHDKNLIQTQKIIANDQNNRIDVKDVKDIANKNNDLKIDENTSNESTDDNGGKFSSTSWTDIANISNLKINNNGNGVSNTDESSITNIVINTDDDDKDNNNQINNDNKIKKDDDKDNDKVDDNVTQDNNENDDDNDNNDDDVNSDKDDDNNDDDDDDISDISSIDSDW